MALILAVLMAVCPDCCPASAAGEYTVGAAGGSGQETMASLDAKGVRIKGQAFPVIFENWGKVRLFTGIDTRERFGLCMFLADDQDNVVYVFPVAHEIRWLTCDEVKAVAFADVDKDGLADVIVIGIYNTGVGSGPQFSHFHVATIYFQKGREFVNDHDLDKQINAAYKNRTIDMVLEFVNSKSLD